MFSIAQRYTTRQPSALSYLTMTQTEHLAYKVGIIAPPWALSVTFKRWFVPILIFLLIIVPISATILASNTKRQLNVFVVTCCEQRTKFWFSHLTNIVVWDVLSTLIGRVLGRIVHPMIPYPPTLDPVMLLCLRVVRLFGVLKCNIWFHWAQPRLNILHCLHHFVKWFMFWKY